MANIQQAAKWLREGKRVRRPDWFDGFYLIVGADGCVQTAYENPFEDLEVEDLLAEDWEEHTWVN